MVNLIFISAGLALINILLIIWSLYDAAPPVFDMACHLLSGFTCADLLSHPHLRDPAWWHSLLAVNPLYPPFVYIVYGIIKILFGPARWVEILVHLLFSSILYISVYGIAKLIFRNAAIALLSALIIFAYPQIFISAHYDLLDMPGLAMVALALFCFTWWQRNTSFYSSIPLGISYTLATLSKNNSAAFLIAPPAIALIHSLIKRDWPKIKYLLLAGLTGLIAILPWLIFASSAMQETIGAIQKQSYETSFISNLQYYISNLPCIPSLLLLLLFISAIFTAGKAIHKQMFSLSASGIFGILLLSLFHWIPQSRYEIPVAIPMALYSGQACYQYWKKPVLRSVLALMTALICFAFMQTAFSPYPVPRLPMPKTFANFLGILPVPSHIHHLPGGNAMCPAPPLDWGYDWVFTSIEPYLNWRQQHMAILPNTEEVSSTIYAYLSKQKAISQQLHPFTIRNWTMIGDEVIFNQKTAALVDWYLLKTGDQGSRLSSNASQQAYDQWYAFVKNSKQFKLIGTKQLPDGSKLELYKISKL